MTVRLTFKSHYGQSVSERGLLDDIGLGRQSQNVALLGSA